MTFIWWLTQEDLKILDRFRLTGHEVRPPLPLWLSRQLASALGRNGRGRLWVDTQFTDPMVVWSASPMAAYCESCAGIVIGQEDLPCLAQLPGVVTDRYLRRV
jgi:hypothetical protein